MALPMRLTMATFIFCGALALAASPAAAETSPAVSGKSWAELETLQYLPKMSPDTVTDYRPAIARDVADIPAPEIGTLPDLVRMLGQLKELARTEPGRWEEGFAYLGANPKEYRPSDAELLAAEVGNRIRAFISKASLGEVVDALKQAGIELVEITYNRFDFRHADVMGTGRYYYCSAPQPVRISLKPD